MNPVASDNSVPPLTEFQAVSKWYGPVIAVNDVTLQLRPGITGLVGPNGAGKSTLIKLLTGQLRPSLGHVRIRGRNAWSARAKSHIGYCPDVDAFYEEMSGRDFVRTLARLHGFRGRLAAERTEAVLEQVGMADRADRRLGSYSKGMRQRIKLAQALVHDPELIVLDEPLNGVDPLGRVGICGDRGDLRDLLLVLADGFGDSVKFGHDGFHGFINAALEGHRICSGGDVLQAFAIDRLSENGRGRGAVAGHIGSFGSNFLDHLCAHIFIRVFEFDLFGD